MSDIAERFAALEMEIAQKRGDFSLFALFLREDAPDRWDLMVSAPWLGDNKYDAVNYLISEIKSHLGEQELVNLSSIVVADPEDNQIQALTRSVRAEHGRLEVRDSNFFGLPIKHAIIITSKSPETPVAR